MKAYFVSPRHTGGWSVKKAGAARSSGIYEKQETAINVARRLTKVEGGELIVQRKTGPIRQKDTIPPAKDPFPPRG